MFYNGFGIFGSGIEAQNYQNEKQLKLLWEKKN